MSALTSSIPGFSSLNSGASDLIKQLMSGSLAPGTKRAIFDAGAERGVAGGMPGSTGRAGSLFANADLRDIGRTSEQQQQQGFQDLLALISNFSGNVAPSAGQEIQARQFDVNAGFQQRQANQAQQNWRSQNELQSLGGFGYDQNNGDGTKYHYINKYFDPKTRSRFDVDKYGSDNTLPVLAGRSTR